MGIKSQEIENTNRIDDGKRMDSNPAVGLEEERLKLWGGGN